MEDIRFTTTVVCRETQSFARTVVMDYEVVGFHCIDHPRRKLTGEEAGPVWAIQADFFLVKKAVENRNAVIERLACASFFGAIHSPHGNALVEGVEAKT